MVAESNLIQPNIQAPIELALKVKNLYLYQERGHADIAAQCGLTVKQVSNLIYREGWSKLKEERRRKIEESHDERATQSQLAVVEAIASQAEEIALSGLNRAREAVGQSGPDAAKNFQSWTGGIKNLVGAMKLVRGGSAAGMESGPTMNLFFMAPGKAGPADPKQAEAIDIQSQ